jgi:exodeoxyribonuclease-1
MQPTFYWFDLETTGVDARRDRPLQFAGLRTDLALRPVEEPRVHYCRPPLDLWPAPAACRVTGIGPRTAWARGECEADFAAAVHDALARPGTCAVGYNSSRFDDEFVRHLFWRTLMEPYAREWREGNSRWDVIDVFRLARALRPEGMEWPEREPGVPSFRLEDLAAANGIDFEAHDALGDVRATVELARRLRRAQPRLFDFAFARRGRESAAALLRLDATTPVLHVSDKYPAARGAIAPVAALARHPWIRNQVIAVDLAADPAPLLDLDAETLAEALFTPAVERADGAPHVPLKTIKLNAAPVLAPASTLTSEAGRRLGIDLDAAQTTLARLRAADGLSQRLQQVYERPAGPASADVDAALYEGFVGDDDRRRANAVLRRAPGDLAGFDPGFTDPRLPELYFRYRARNWPEHLDAAEQARWQALRGRRLLQGEAGSPRSLAVFDAALAEEQASARLEAAMHAELRAWREQLLADLPAGAGQRDG